MAFPVFLTFSSNKLWWRLHAYSFLGTRTRESRVALPLKGRLRQLRIQHPDSWVPPQIVHPTTCKIEECEVYAEWSWVGNLLSVSINVSSCLDNNLFCANRASCEVSSNRLFLVGIWARSLQMAMSLAAMLSIKSIASSGVFIMILPSAEASKSCLDCGLNPSINMLSCIGPEKPWSGVFRNKLLNLSSASLSDSSVSQPTFGGRATSDSRDACSTKGIRAESPPTFIWGKRRKNRKRRDLRTF